MRKFVFSLSNFLIVFFVCVLSVYHATEIAQAQEDAPISRDTQGREVSLGSVLTSPYGEVIIKTDTGQVEAVSSVGATGRVDLNFNSQEVDFLVEATDILGITTEHITLSSGEAKEILLPPTIVVADVLGKYSSVNRDEAQVQLVGFTYPGAVVEIVIFKDKSEIFRLKTQPADGSGRWTHTLENVQPGEFIVSAVATYDSLSSKKGIPLGFTVFEPEVVSVFVQGADVVSKAALPVAATAFVFQTGLSTFSLKDILTYLTRIYLWIMGVLFPAKGRRRWGVIYNSITKQPLTSAIVRLYKDSGGLVETTVTGKNGVFSFLLNPGKYKLQVRKPGFKFPSAAVSGAQDGEYRDLYFGDVLGISSVKPVVNSSIPLDPVEYKGKSGRFLKLTTFIKNHTLTLNSVLFIPGFVFSFLALFNSTTLYNQVVFVFYLVSSIYFIYDILVFSRSWGVVVDEKGKSISGVALSLFDTAFGRLVHRRVSDSRGRYQFLVPKGEYKISISSPEWKLEASEKAYSGGAILVEQESELVKPKIAVGKSNPPETG